MKIERKEKGFTLVELLVVMAILGILAAVAIPAYQGSKYKKMGKTDCCPCATEEVGNKLKPTN